MKQPRNKRRPIVLVTCDYYLPGYKGGGPIRTLNSMVEHLGSEFDFKIVTRDRDYGDCETYQGITSNNWQPIGKADVFYCTPDSLSLSALYRLVKITEHDVLYLNSFFSLPFTVKLLLLRRLGLIPKVPLILAPRGELSPGALSIKSFIKRIYFVISKVMVLYNDVIWQASSDYEKKDIIRKLGDFIQVIVAPDLVPSVQESGEHSTQYKKNTGKLKVIFLSRISRVKNLDGALMMLRNLNGEINFNIYGPLEDPEYWVECQKVIKLLPQNVEVRYYGAVLHDNVPTLIREHDLFFLPTHGENFGHVILEALVAGCPVLISDKTLWRDLINRGVGWDLPLEQPERFQEVLQQCVDMNAQTHQAWSQRAREYGLKCSQDQKAAIEQNQDLFRQALMI